MKDRRKRWKIKVQNFGSKNVVKPDQNLWQHQQKTALYFDKKLPNPKCFDRVSHELTTKPSQYLWMKQDIYFFVKLQNTFNLVAFSNGKVRASSSTWIWWCLDINWLFFWFWWNWSICILSLDFFVNINPCWNGQHFQNCYNNISGN